MENIFSKNTIKKTREIAKLVSTFDDEQVTDMIYFVAIRLVGLGFVMGVAIGAAMCVCIAWSKT